MTRVVRHPLVSGHPPKWASGWGQDRQGIFASFVIAGIEQRMRWIPPGRFVMGSPPNEPERFVDEEEREITIPDGFWLGDTAVTQELYTAVAGENPSRYPGDNRPVEQVSWDDAQEFLTRVNDRIDGVELRLPREAEWEYACRAGTTTPFSFGASITTDQVNYDGNYPYAESPKGEYRNETVEVRGLPKNPWGLFEMHGNVWEWCEERAKAWTVDRGVVLDRDSGPLRVLRGGSWYDFARGCRSARRLAYDPSSRDSHVGFRVARGQGLGTSLPPEP